MTYHIRCSIPHATSPPVSHTLSVSPTNVATSPIRESPLAELEVQNNVDELEPVSGETFEAEETTAAVVPDESKHVPS